MRPLEALEVAIGTAFFYLRRRTYGNPGAIISKMSAEVREALVNLTSKDMDNCQPIPDIEDDSAKADRILREEKLKFDKKLKG